MSMNSSHQLKRKHNEVRDNNNDLSAQYLNRRAALLVRQERERAEFEDDFSRNNPDLIRAKDVFLTRLRVEMNPTKILDEDFVDQLRREVVSAYVKQPASNEETLALPMNTTSSGTLTAPRITGSSSAGSSSSSASSNTPAPDNTATAATTCAVISQRTRSVNSSSSTSPSSSSSSTHFTRQTSPNRPQSSSNSSSSAPVRCASVSPARTRKATSLQLKDLAQSLKKSEDEGILRVPRFVQRSPGVLGGRGGEIKRDVDVHIIHDADVAAMMTWAVEKIDAVSLSAYGLSKKDLCSQKYWKNDAKKGVSFCVTLDGQVTGYVKCDSINNVDGNDLPLHHGAGNLMNQKVHRNLACLTYLKTSSHFLDDDMNTKGVMQFATGTVISWLFAAEARLEGAMAVIKTPGDDKASKIPQVTQMWDRSRRLILALPYNARKLKTFRGSRMGTMNVYLMLRP